MQLCAYCGGEVGERPYRRHDIAGVFCNRTCANRYQEQWG